MTAAYPCSGLVDAYLAQLSNDFEVSSVDGICYIASPFARPDGEVIELEFTSLPNGQTRISDMGDTLAYLYVNGLTLTRTVLDRARDVARGYGVTLERNALVAAGSPEVNGEDIHRLIQAALAVASLIHGRRTASRVIFDDEVESFIIQTGATYDSDFIVQGARERHTFKFHVNSGANLLIQPLSAATESAAHAAAERWAYRAIDVTQDNSALKPLVVLDDRNNRRNVWTHAAQAPINEFAILWENRQRLEEMLVAVVP